MTGRIPFTEDEDTLLRDMWPTTSAQDIAIHFNRATATIRARSVILGLPPKTPRRALNYAKATATRNAEKAYVETFPKVSITMEAALKGRTYGKPRRDDGEFRPLIDGRRLVKSIAHGSTGSAALLCAEA